MNREVLVAHALDAVRDALSRGLRVLVFGGRSSNLPEWVRDDPRIDFRDNTNPGDDVAIGGIPLNIGVILGMKFVDHKQTTPVKTEERNLRLPYFIPLSGVEIRTILGQAFGIDQLDANVADEVSAGDGEPIKPMSKRVSCKELSEFLVGALNADNLSPNVLTNTKEISRLLLAARRCWPKTTSAQIRRALERALLELGAMEKPLNEPAVVYGNAAEEADAKPAAGAISSVRQEDVDELRSKVTKLKRDNARLQKLYQRLKQRETTLVTKRAKEQEANREVSANLLREIAELRGQLSAILARYHYLAEMTLARSLLPGQE